MIYGFGLIKGLYVTAKRLLSKKVTEQYPDVLPDLPPRSHGSFAFSPDKCIACNICADSCPNGVIKVEYFKDEKGKKVLENYRMNLGYCLFCGQCVSSCPKQAIYFVSEFNLACLNKEDTVKNFRGNVYKKEAVAGTAPQNTVQSGQEVK
jgi:NADH-quinone oxidoreductase subunit I